MNEAETRAEHIDPALAAAGWGIIEGSRIRREYPITLGRLEGAGRRGKSLTADYVLEYRNTKLAVVEAKAWDKALTEGVAQAKDYAGKLAVRFAYACNGRGIYGIDLESAAEGEITRYPSPVELWSLTFAAANTWRDRFAAVLFEDRGGFFQGRYYQDIAVEQVLAAIAAGQERILLTLATGTGKTFIAFQIAWKLFHSRWNLADRKGDGEPSRRPRILFLADRNILADQAYNAFSAFDDKALVRIDPADIRKKGKVPKNGSIFFTIFQTFMSGPPKNGHPSPYFGEYPPDFFDFIVIDECHRGGARLHDGKDYFTIYDFVKAHHHFNDPEWDGEPIEPEACAICRQVPCLCMKEPPHPCYRCGKSPCECAKDPCPKCHQWPCVCRKKAKVQLDDGKSRTIQHMTVTSFWHPDGTPMSAQQFMEALFGRLPDFFKDEDELRALWSAPETRRKLLEGLAEKGFGKEQLAEMQKIVDAEKGDLFDVLAYVAYALEPQTRKERADQAMALISRHFNSRQQVFLDFVLSHYVAVGVDELDQTKLTPLLKLKYHDSIADAVADLGRPDEIGKVFAGFQKYLYQQQAAA